MKALLIEDTLTSSTLLSHQLRKMGIEPLVASDGMRGIEIFKMQRPELVLIAMRSGDRISLLLCDVDYFNAFNDRYGHQAGDACLKQVGAVLRECARRPADIATCYGCEEFVVLLPQTGDTAVNRGRGRLQGC